MSRVLEQKSREQMARKRQRLQLLLMMLEDWMYKEDAQGMLIDSVIIRHGRDKGGDHMVIVKARMEGRPHVAFHSGQTPEDALSGALEGIRSNAAKWRVDKPYEDRDKG